MAAWVAISRSRRFRFTDAGTSSSHSPARVPSSCEYVKTPTWSKPTAVTKPLSSSKSASVSPGNPTMNVVRRETSGIRVRMLSSSVSYDLRVPGRRMRFRTASDACCSGRSMYFTTFSHSAMASIIPASIVVG